MSVCFECTARRAGCGATCDKFKAERAENAKRYKDNAVRVEIGWILSDGCRRMMSQGARWTRRKKIKAR